VQGDDVYLLSAAGSGLVASDSQTLTGQAITVGRVTATAGSVTIAAGDNLFLEAGTLVKAGVAVTIRGDAAAIDGYLGRGDRFDLAIGKFAVAYADQTERDHAALEKAWRAGRIVAEAEAD
jgi:hypothetical protein